MQLISLTLEGIGSYQEPFGLDFADSTLIIGPNGAGKSWIIEGICLCLFGRTVRNVNVDSILNWHVREGVASLEFAHDGKLWRSDFYRERKQRTAMQLFSFYRDEFHSEGYARQTDVLNALQNLIGVEWEVFRQSSLFGQNDLSQFLNGTDLQRRLLLGSLVGIDRFLDLQKQVKTDAKKLEERGFQLQTQINMLEEASEAEVVGIAALQEQEAGLRLHLETLQEQFSKDLIRQKEQQQLSQQVITAKQELYQCDIQIKQQNQEMEKLQKQLREVVTKRRHFWDSYLEKLVASPWRQKKEEASHPITFDELCAETDALGLEWLNAQHLEHQILALTDSLTVLGKERQQLQQQKDNLGVPLPPFDLGEIQENLQRVTHLREQVLQQLAVAQSKAQERQEAQNKCAFLQRVQKKVHQDREVLRCLEVAFGPKGIPFLLLEENVKALTSLANQHLGALGGNMQVDISAYRETSSGDLKESLRVVVRQQDRETELNSFSGGEKQRIELALRFALADLCPITSDLLLLDEVTSGLDVDGLMMVQQRLQQMRENGKQILAITHEGRMETAFEKVVQL